MKYTDLNELDRLDVKRRLQRIAYATENNLPNFYLSKSPETSRIHLDDSGAGRTQFALAHARATQGLTKLIGGDLDGATQFLAEAERASVEVLISISERGHLDHLRHGAKPRARPKKRERDRLLAEAVIAQEAKGVKGKAARRAAMDSDDRLQEFKSLSDKSTRDALARGRKILAG